MVEDIREEIKKHYGGIAKRVSANAKTRKRAEQKMLNSSRVTSRISLWPMNPSTSSRPTAL